MSTTNLSNIASLFFEKVVEHPDKLAFVVPKNINDEATFFEELITYRDFSQKVKNFQTGLKNHNYTKGDRIIILAPMDENVYALMLAMFSLGLVAVFLDPGIGVKKILTAISDSKSKAIVSIDRLLKYHWLVPQLWSMKKYSLDKRRIGVSSIASLYQDNAQGEKLVELLDSDHALITFTSGSTGRAKGSDRNVFNVKKQIEFIKNSWNCESDTIDFPSFPMFGFMNLLYGLTTVVPAVDFANISSFNPKILAKQMLKWRVTRTCGSFAFNDKLSKFLEKNDIQITTIKNIALGGCPVTSEFCSRLKKTYPNAQTRIIYGSTEVAPISHMNIEDFLTSKGNGFPVGSAYPGVEIKVVKLPERIEEFKDGDLEWFEVQRGEVGEVIIRSTHTVQQYVDNKKATRENKIRTRGLSWHRTGDTGYLTDDNQLWLVGRINDTIFSNDIELHPFMIEQKVDQLSEVERSALVQVNDDVILFIEVDSEKEEKEFTEIKNKIGYHIPSDLHARLIYKKIKKIPVDDRHKSKINRVKLRQDYRKNSLWRTLDFT